jgi:hypothetical protein
MPLTLDRLRAVVDPHHTVLLLGAGASVPSGAPSASQLAETLWRDVAKTDPMSEDLKETASILDRRFGRHAVVTQVRKSLKDLKASGGLLALPPLGWHSIFTTNFDRLMETSFKRNGIRHSVIRSNFDLTNKENRIGTSIYKLHGCISQDRAFGDKPSMILTEYDYEQFDRYRQTLFSMLQTSMLTNDVLIIGQSLRDPHLSDLIKKVLLLRQEGVNTQVYSIIFDEDDLRAPLLEDKGAQICFGSIDSLAHSLAIEVKSEPALPVGGRGLELPQEIVSTAIDIGAELSKPSNPSRMFNGGPATYSDIRNGITFERSRAQDAFEHLSALSTPVVVLIGAAGVGKTSFARQLALACSEAGKLVWEHNTDFPFIAKHWMEFEQTLRSAGAEGILLVDECTHNMRQVNQMVEYLSKIKTRSLRLICTANSSQWRPRLKSKYFFTDSLIIELGQLDSAEINGLLNLHQRNPGVAQLASRDFGTLSRDRQFKRLQDRCSADMFVCLRNIFANENLDTILLTEYDDLEANLQEYYRYVAALESVGTRVHRQLIMRMLGIGADEVSSALTGLSGIIDEYDIKPKDGIFGWTTRHIVIARTITEYKFSDYAEIEELFEQIIDNINPAVPLELQSIRDLCDRKHGIGRLNEASTRQRLYEKLISVAEGERIPWHRLVAEQLENSSIESADITLRNAIDAVGADGPLDRFRVRILLRRANETKGISDADRLALTRKALEAGEACIKHHPYDKFAYRTLCEVAVELVRRGESPYVLDEAIGKLRQASDEILDPEMDQILLHFERIRARM